MWFKVQELSFLYSNPFYVSSTKNTCDQRSLLVHYKLLSNRSGNSSAWGCALVIALWVDLWLRLTTWSNEQNNFHFNWTMVGQKQLFFLEKFLWTLFLWLMVTLFWPIERPRLICSAEVVFPYWQWVITQALQTCLWWPTLSR